MTEREAFIAAICEAPDEDTPRLAFADWLDEHGEAERAEFIRVQVELAIIAARHYRECTGTITRDMETALLRRRERKLLSNVASRTWFPLPGASVGYGDGETGCRWHVEGGAIEGESRRGFVEELTCSAQDWLAHADAIRAAHPIRKVTLTTMPTVADFGYRAWFNVDRGEFALNQKKTLEHLYPRITFILPDTVPVHVDNQWREEPINGANYLGSGEGSPNE